MSSSSGFAGLPESAQPFAGTRPQCSAIVQLAPGSGRRCELDSGHAGLHQATILMGSVFWEGNE